MNLEMHGVTIEYPEGCSIVIGQAHFVGTVEALRDVIQSELPDTRYGVAFCEASGDYLIRTEGNDDGLVKGCTTVLKAIGAGHVFCILLADTHPIPILNQIKNCRSVCTVYCATTNPLQAIVASTLQGWGIIGVIDGFPPQGVEDEEERERRRELLREIGYSC